MADGSYNQFCPVAMAAEILCTRWTMIVLRELVAGSTRFNELRRGVPRMSPALLSKRLKDLEAAGIVARSPVAGDPDAHEYTLTAAGKELAPVVCAVGEWGQKWVTTESSLGKLDPSLLMWDMRRNINTKPMPPRRSVIQVIFSEQPEARRNWWLIVEPGVEADLCSVDPGFDVDLYVVTDLRTMTEIWMGYKGVARAKADGRLVATGDRQLDANLQAWLGLSPFAKFEKAVA
jgi:DNA-binding HxlR family transcriptional regulator